jgi:hypothetical protein
LTEADAAAERDAFEGLANLPFDDISVHVQPFPGI